MLDLLKHNHISIIGDYRLDKMNNFIKSLINCLKKKNDELIFLDLKSTKSDWESIIDPLYEKMIDNKYQFLKACRVEESIESHINIFIKNFNFILDDQDLLYYGVRSNKSDELAFKIKRLMAYAEELNLRFIIIDTQRIYHNEIRQFFSYTKVFLNQERSHLYSINPKVQEYYDKLDNKEDLEVSIINGNLTYHD